MMQTQKPTFKYYRQQQTPKLTLTPSIKFTNPLTNSRCSQKLKHDQALMSKQRITQLVETYNKQVLLSWSLREHLRTHDKSSAVLCQLGSFVEVDPEKCDNLIQRLSQILDLNSKMKNEIQKWETRQEIQREFKLMSVQQLPICQQSHFKKQKFARQKIPQFPSDQYQFSLRQQQQSTDKQTDQNEYYPQGDYNNNPSVRRRNMRNCRNLSVKASCPHPLKQIKNLWIKDTQAKSESLSQMERLDEFVQDLNKKVVMTRVKVHELVNLEKSSFIQETHSLCNGQCQYQAITQLKRKLEVMQQQMSMYQRKVTQMERQIIQKDKRIVHLNETISKLNFTDKADNLAVPDQHQIFSKVFIQKKTLSIDTDKINSQSQITNQQQHQNSPCQNQALPLSDPVFSIPCLSPMMLQMKSIERMEVERRKKLRQLRKDPTGTKIIVKDFNSMAAGIASPISQQLIKEAINPLKNRFIRKPMSPVMGSLYISPKTSQAVTQTSIILQNQESSQIIKDQKEGKSADEDKQPEEKLNLPYFVSLKNKNKQN